MLLLDYLINELFLLSGEPSQVKRSGGGGLSSSSGQRIRSNLVQTSVDFTSDSHSFAVNPNA